MAKLPEPVYEHTTAQAIVKWYDKKEEDPRPHLGASEIGKPCDRQLWYSFRWCTKKKFEGRIKRLFQTGHREESRFLEELRGIGAEIYDKDPDTKQQHRFSAVEGHFGGSCDAIGRGLPEAPKSWAVVEFKTHGDKSFTELKAKGVEKAKPEHFAQMQVYMGLAELERALYLSCNKNTDELHSEWIHFNKARFDELMQRAEYIISTDQPPQGISTDPSWYQCKFCDHHAVCHKQAPVQKNCRTCAFATPGVNGAWECGKHNLESIPFETQMTGCDKHLFIPPLITYGEPIDSGNDFVLYQFKGNETKFANVATDADREDVHKNFDTEVIACYTSAELSVTPPSVIADTNVAQLKTTFKGSSVVATTAIEDDDIPF